MIPPRALEQLALGIADGEPVDWNRLAGDQVSQPEVEALRLIAAIAAAHREDDAPPGSR